MDRDFEWINLPSNTPIREDCPLCIIDDASWFSHWPGDVLGSCFRKAFLSEIIPDRNQACRWSLSGERWTTPPLNWDRRFRFKGQTVSGMCSSTLQKDHINLLEMRAVLLALSHFKLCLESLSIVLATDNTTVVAYLKNQGGTHCCTLYQLAKDVLGNA
jgi:hypothetical protein